MFNLPTITAREDLHRRAARRVPGCLQLLAAPRLQGVDEGVRLQALQLGADSAFTVLHACVVAKANASAREFLEDTAQGAAAITDWQPPAWPVQLLAGAAPDGHALRSATLLATWSTQLWLKSPVADLLEAGLLPKAAFDAMAGAMRVSTLAAVLSVLQRAQLTTPCRAQIARTLQELPRRPRLLYAFRVRLLRR